MNLHYAQRNFNDMTTTLYVGAMQTATKEQVNLQSLLANDMQNVGWQYLFRRMWCGVVSVFNINVVLLNRILVDLIGLLFT